MLKTIMIIIGIFILLPSLVTADIHEGEAETEGPIDLTSAGDGFFDCTGGCTMQGVGTFSGSVVKKGGTLTFNPGAGVINGISASGSFSYTSGSFDVTDGNVEGIALIEASQVTVTKEDSRTIISGIAGSGNNVAGRRYPADTRFTHTEPDTQEADLPAQGGTVNVPGYGDTSLGMDITPSLSDPDITTDSFGTITLAPGVSTTLHPDGQVINALDDPLSFSVEAARIMMDGQNFDYNPNQPDNNFDISVTDQDVSDLPPPTVTGSIFDPVRINLDGKEVQGTLIYNGKANVELFSLPPLEGTEPAEESGFIDNLMIMGLRRYGVGQTIDPDSGEHIPLVQNRELLQQDIDNLRNLDFDDPDTKRAALLMTGGALAGIANKALSSMSGGPSVTIDQNGVRLITNPKSTLAPSIVGSLDTTGQQPSSLQLDFKNLGSVGARISVATSVDGSQVTHDTLPGGASLQLYNQRGYIRVTSLEDFSLSITSTDGRYTGNYDSATGRLSLSGNYKPNNWGASFNFYGSIEDFEEDYGAVFSLVWTPGGKGFTSPGGFRSGKTSSGEQKLPK